MQGVYQCSNHAYVLTGSGRRCVHVEHLHLLKLWDYYWDVSFIIIFFNVIIGAI